jgi:hypothetical protein
MHAAVAPAAQVLTMHHPTRAACALTNHFLKHTAASGVDICPYTHRLLQFNVANHRLYCCAAHAAALSPPVFCAPA